MVVFASGFVTCNDSNLGTIPDVVGNLNFPCFYVVN